MHERINHNGHPAIPDFAKKGTLIRSVPKEQELLLYRPEEYQQQIVEAITRNVEANPHWEYGGYYRKAMTAAGEIIPRLFNSVLIEGRDQMPFPVIGFGDLRNYRILASYRLVPNRFGMNFEITFNTQQMRDVERDGKTVKEWRYTDWHFHETEVHEFAHCWQQTVLKIPWNKIRHDAKWRAKMAEFGIRTNGRGEHLLPLPEEGTPFAVLMRDLMVSRPDVAKLQAELGEGDVDLLTLIKLLEALFGKEGKKRRGRSTLILYECPECHTKARIGVKADVRISCVACEEEKGVKVEPRVLFERKD